MVSPELAHEYARRGIALMDPEAGVDALLREIAAGEDVQVIFVGDAKSPRGCDPVDEATP
jgi:hypothetical protein